MTAPVYPTRSFFSGSTGATPGTTQRASFFRELALAMMAHQGILSQVSSGTVTPPVAYPATQSALPPISPSILPRTAATAKVLRNSTMIAAAHPIAKAMPKAPAALPSPVVSTEVPASPKLVIGPATHAVTRQSLEVAQPDPVAVSDPAPVAQTAASGPTSSGALSLADYPRPSGDTGLGFDWVPTLHSDPAVVDHFVNEAKKLGASWIVFLNDGTQIGANDYLVQQLVANHIEPVMRIYTDHGSAISGDLTAMVQHYTGLGVHYFLPYNEPNLPNENPNGVVSVDSYVNRWVSAARDIVAGGGLPGLGALAPAAPTDDLQFLRDTLQAIRDKGQTGLLDNAWIALHNYSFNRPTNYMDTSNGFLKFRWYDKVVQDVLGRDLPILGTEGGPRIGDKQDPRFPAVDQSTRDQLVADEVQYLGHREPYFFVQTLWLLMNQAGGGHDPAWNKDALFQSDGSPTPLVAELEQASGGAA